MNLRSNLISTLAVTKELKSALWAAFSAASDVRTKVTQAVNETAQCETVWSGYIVLVMTGGETKGYGEYEHCP